MRRSLGLAAAIALALGFAGVLHARSRKVKAGPVAGIWACMAHGGQNGPVPFTLHLHESGATVEGWVSSSLGDADITTAAFKHSRLKIHIDTDQGNYLIVGKLRHGKLSGSWSHGNEKGSWTGHRAAASSQGQ